MNDCIYFLILKGHPCSVVEIKNLTALTGLLTIHMECNFF